MYLVIVILVILGSFEICDGVQSFSIHEFFLGKTFWLIYSVTVVETLEIQQWPLLVIFNSACFITYMEIKNK